MLLHMLMSKIQVTFSKYLFVKESFRLQYLLGFIFSCKQLAVIKKHYISNERIKTNFHSYFEHESWFLICKSATTFKVQNRKFTCKTKFWQKREKTSKLWFPCTGLWLGYFVFEIFQDQFGPHATQFLADVMIDLVSMVELAMKDGTGNFLQ